MGSKVYNVVALITIRLTRNVLHYWEKIGCFPRQYKLKKKEEALFILLCCYEIFHRIKREWFYNATRHVLFFYAYTQNQVLAYLQH